MLTPVQSQRYAQLVNKFNEKEFYAYYKHLSEGGRVEDFFEKMEKHQEHDQSSHGNWATGSHDASVISTDTQIAFHDGAIKATDNILSPSAYKSQLTGNLNRTYPKTYLDEATKNPAYQEALQTHLKRVGFPETVRVFSSSAQEGEYLHGSVAPLWDSGAVGYESKESPKEFSVSRSDIIGIGKVADSGIWFRNSKDVKKHGTHDQKTHGSWATGVTSELSEWSPKDKVPDAPRNATGTTDKFWENWEHGVDGDQFVDLYRQYAGEMLGLPVPKSDKDVGGSENYLTQRGFGASSTSAVRNQTEAVLTAIANGRPQPTLYRGMTGSDAESKALLEQFTNLKEGDTIDMPLVSTTRSLGVAQWYAADRSYTPSDTKVILKIQEGAKGVSVNREKSFYPSDFETITSGKFQVVGISAVTTPYWARGAVHARTFELSRPGEDLVTGYRFQDPKDLSWDRKDSNDPAAKVRYEIIRDGANTGNFSKIETSTLKYTNDRQPSGVKNVQDITVNSWTRKEPTTFTVIEVKLVEPHVVRKAESNDYGLTFDALFNNIPFIREEDIAKHGEHDQQTHGNWASGNYENLADWFKDEVKVFESETEKEVYFMEKLFSQRLKSFTEMAYPEFSGAISFYESRGGYDMNEALRDPQISDDGYKSTIDLLDKAMDIAPALSEELVAYRGVKGNGLKFFENLKVGDTYQDKGYTSTTIDAGVAQQFGGSQPYYDGLVFRMQLPAGTKGIFPSGYHEPAYGWTPSMTEAEFLLPRDSKFRVVAQRGKVWDVQLVKP